MKKSTGNNGIQSSFFYGNLKKEVDAKLTALDKNDFARRLFKNHDATLWGTDAEQRKTIANRLGWLQLPQSFAKHAADCMAFAKKIKEEDFKYVVVLGMGGSSLSPEVARQVFGTIKGYMQLLILDNTSPQAVLDVEKQIDLNKTIFIVASKSGTTIEPDSFLRYFYSKVKSKVGPKAGRHFVAITDKGTALAKNAVRLKFRKTFINPGDIGGRYSVLSYFGLLPMALSGINVNLLLQKAALMFQQCLTFPKVSNPGIALGALLGIAQQDGRDKITFILSSTIQSFGYWAEQLIAESTGKNGKGLIPVHGEELRKPKHYRNDRVFINMHLAGDKVSGSKQITALKKAGHPVVDIELSMPIDLGAEFYRWEVATAVAGLIMGINPFNEPNVAESKDNTNRLLAQKDKKNTEQPEIKKTGIAIFEGEAIKAKTGKPKNHLKNLFKILAKINTPGSYVALLPYLPENKNYDKQLSKLRNLLQVNLKTATTLLHGPRYLHSTGQLHKGGPDSGIYLMFTEDDKTQLAIPGQKFNFNQLHHAQAMGDFLSLDKKGRRVVRIHLGENAEASLKKLCSAAGKAFE